MSTHPERRRQRRQRASAAARVLRDSDAMRIGIEASLKDVTTEGVGIIVREPPQLHETVGITLTNLIQKVSVGTRGVVRHVTPLSDGSFLVGIELLVRLTPLTVSLLRMGVPDEADEQPHVI